jgi:hypothetical protein
MKKFISVLLVFVLVFAMASTAMAEFSREPNANPHGPYGVFDGIMVEIGHLANEGQWLRAHLVNPEDDRLALEDNLVDGKFVLLDTGFGTHVQPWFVFGQWIYVQVHGNSIHWVYNHPDGPKEPGPTPPEPDFTIVTRKENVTKSEIGRTLTNVSVLGQVDRVVFQNPNQGNNGNGTGAGFLVGFSATATLEVTYRLEWDVVLVRVYCNGSEVEVSRETKNKEFTKTTVLNASAGDGQIHMGGGQNATSGRTLTLSNEGFSVTFTANNSSANQNAVTAVATFNDGVLDQSVPVTVTITNHIGNN